MKISLFLTSKTAIMCHNRSEKIWIKLANYRFLSGMKSYMVGTETDRSKGHYVLFSECDLDSGLRRQMAALVWSSHPLDSCKDFSLS